MNLTRYIQKIFGSNSAADQIRKFGSLAAGSPANATTPAEVQELANYLGGWPSAVLGNNSPALEDMNALQYLFSYQLSYLMQKGVPEWETGTTYYTGDIARNSSGILFVSLTDDNQGNALTDAAEWKPWTPNEYVSGVTYGDGDRVHYNGVWYISRQAANQGNTPAAVSLWWRIDTGKFIGEQIFLGQDTSPDGTLGALGQPISRTDYADLFAVYGTKFGDGSKNADGTASGFSGTHFNLPKSQGQFMRFPDDGASIDPNAGARTAMNDGGATGDNIGSIQGDEFESHNHGGGVHNHSLTNVATADNGSGGRNHGGDVTRHGLVPNTNDSGTIINTEGGSETRPTNAYFNKMYIVF